MMKASRNDGSAKALPSGLRIPFVVELPGTGANGGQGMATDTSGQPVRSAGMAQLDGHRAWTGESRGRLYRSRQQERRLLGFGGHLYAAVQGDSKMQRLWEVFILLYA